MVALKQEWCNEILMINIALFCLKKTDILANPVEQILSGDYLNGIQTIINNDLQTQREIAALVYGVDVEDARQIPLKKYIEGCINGEEDHDINQYAETNWECWEHLCRQYVSGNIIDGIVYNMASRWWGKIFTEENKEGAMVELDVVAESIDRKHILIGECKWTNKGRCTKACKFT